MLEQWVVDKYHGQIKDSIKKNIEQSNFNIQFIEPTIVIQEVSGGFTGRVIRVQLKKIDDKPFGVLSVEKDKKKQCSRIHVWSDGCCDGYNCFLINVPNGLFNQLNKDESCN